MQDINKSEILEKLDKGWKVRCKAWDKGEYLHKEENIEVLLAYYSYDEWEAEPPKHDEWEAEPPKPVIVVLYSEQFLEDAISLIRKDTKRFIRRRCVNAVWTTIGWHNNELWHLDIENKLDPSHQVVFRRDSFKVNNCNVCVLE